MVKIIKFVREEMKKYAMDKPIGDNFFLARALRLHKEKPDYFTNTEVYSTAAANINAGSDTTSISLTAVMWNLLKHPESFAKVWSIALSVTTNYSGVPPNLKFTEHW